MTFWEAVAIGDAHDLGTYVFTRERIARFAERFDPQPFHLEAAAAERSVLGGLCASGWHVAAAFMRLNVDFYSDWAARRAEAGLSGPVFGPSPGVSQLRWVKPVFVDDALGYRQVIEGVRKLASRPDWGLVATRVTAHDQDGRLCFEMSARVLLRTD